MLHPVAMIEEAKGAISPLRLIIFILA